MVCVTKLFQCSRRTSSALRCLSDAAVSPYSIYRLIHFSYFYECEALSNPGNLGLAAERLIQASALQRIAHTRRDGGDVMLRFRSASRESDCLWLMPEKSREIQSWGGWYLVPILSSFSLAAPGAQWCNTGDLFVTDRPRFPPAADWPSAGMNGPLCFWVGGGLCGVRQMHVTPLRKKARLVPLPRIWARMRLMAELTVRHTCRRERQFAYSIRWI